MKFFLNKFLIPIVILIVLAGCRKFEEDPFISVRRPGARLVRVITGTGCNWKITSYKINDTEHSHDFDNLLKPYTLTDCMMSVGLIRSYVTYGVFYFTDPNGDGYIPFGYGSYSEYHLNDNETEIEFTYAKGNLAEKYFFEGGLNALPPDSFSTRAWKIIKLYKNELHIRRGSTDIYFKRGSQHS